MSSINEKKEAKEQSAFNLAVRLAEIKQGKTFEIIKFLNGEKVSRGKEDSPDIIRKCTKGEKSPFDVYVGIEHFCCDQVSKKKKGKITSIREEQLSKIDNKRKNDKNYSTQSLEYQNDQFDLATFAAESGMEELLESLEASLMKHLSNADKYREEVSKIAGTSKIELAFLIDINCILPYLFLNDENGFKENSTGLVPITDEIVNLLAKLNKKVEYVILLLRSCFNENLDSVIAIRTGNIRKHLSEQGIPIYKYCADDIKYKFKRKSDDTFNKEIIEYSDNFDEICKKIMESEYSKGYSIIKLKDGKLYLPQKIADAYKKSLIYKRKKIKFATTKYIQLIIYAFGNNVKYTKIAENEYLFEVPIYIEYAIKKSKDFNECYNCF